MLTWSGFWRPGERLSAADADRPLLIGTARAVRDLRRMLRGESRAARPIGCVLVGPRPLLRAPLKVLGEIDQLDTILRVHRIRKVLLSIPVAMHALAARIIARLEENGVTVRQFPTLRDQLEGRAPGPIASPAITAGRAGGNGSMSDTHGAAGNGAANGSLSGISAARAACGVVDPAQLLRRTPHPLDEGSIRQTLRGRRVLITGAGGSIGSHIARIAARFEPAELLLMERSENNLFEVDRRLAAEFPRVGRRPLLHDVADAPRTLELTARFRPEVVFHAAAHKHVSMMEDHPREAVVNNFFGTKSIADAARSAGAERFVMISSDKAVNPASVMGATKRMGELYIQHLATRSRTIFSIVRFGNVLGSACSVAPIWADQLARGEPITVTDRRMTRYFMTMPEAASLVIQAASLEQAGGSIFVLDMGEPVRILDLARRFLELSGLDGDDESHIVFTGTRPGEKLDEQLAYDHEDMLPTSHRAVRLMVTRPPAEHRVRQMVRRFESLVERGDTAALLGALRDAVGRTGDEAAPAVNELAA